MTQLRNTDPDGATTGPAPDLASLSVAGARPLSARSVVASTLLGIEPPRLPTRLLVRSGELFGISEGTTRVALSRMVAAGELEIDGTSHALAGRLLERQARQHASRVPEAQAWDGRWTMAVVVGGARPGPARAELREAMRELHLAELREGVWLRPDNLDDGWSARAEAVVDAQCRRFRVELAETVTDATSAVALAAQLWDLDTWAARAGELRVQLDQVAVALEDGDTAALAPGFVLSAAVLRHLLADPVLPQELLDADWPGDDLRRDYDRYDRAFKALWRDWFRQAQT
jgi:phenylacetic acid degradation operon negative regulatory protein